MFKLRFERTVDSNAEIVHRHQNPFPSFMEGGKIIFHILKRFHGESASVKTQGSYLEYFFTQWRIYEFWNFILYLPKSGPRIKHDLLARLNINTPTTNFLGLVVFKRTHRIFCYVHRDRSFRYNATSSPKVIRLPPNAKFSGATQTSKKKKPPSIIILITIRMYTHVLNRVKLSSVTHAAENFLRGHNLLSGTELLLCILTNRANRGQP